MTATQTVDDMPFRFTNGHHRRGRVSIIADRETLLLALVIYTSWLAATYFHRWIPPLLLPVVGGWILAWHGSLQHETIHGHPTHSDALNDLIGGAPISLWLPYERYRESHLRHHASDDLTEPSSDPESRYLTPRTGPKARVQVAVATWTSTLLGRLTLGPAVEIATFVAREVARLARRDRHAWGIWGVHLFQAALVVGWLKLVCHMSLLLYGVAFIYPGAALTLLRSFAEHRAAEEHGHRIAIVENAPILGLLFLNNNLHAVHHRHPGAPWSRLPELYRRQRSAILFDNGGFVYDGYREVFRRFLLAPHDALFHRAAMEAE
jgi:fatty acid desaturase